MNTTIKSLAWAGMIIAAAIVAKQNGLGEAESFALMTGLIAAAVATLRLGKGCCWS